MTLDDETPLDAATMAAVLEHAPDGVVVHADGMVLYANHTARALLAAESELPGTISLFEFVQPVDRATVLARAGRLYSGGREPPIELTLVRRDGALVEVEISAAPVRVGGRAAAVMFLRDIGERLQLRARMAQVERSSALATLAAGVAHQVNNPLAYVRTNLEVVKDDLLGLRDADPVRVDDMREAIADALHGTDRVARVARDLAELAGSGDSDELTDVERTIESALRLVGYQLARDRVAVETSIEPLPPVLGSEARLVQVLVHVLLNASEAIATRAREAGGDRSGTVKVTAHCDPRGRAQVIVEDDGPGIAPEVLPRVFDPFFTTKRAGGTDLVGAGLGLAICRGIVSSLGGEIGLESEQGHGARVCITLPAAERRAPREAGLRASRAPAIGRPRVLVIDDEPLVITAVTRVLRDCDVIGATSAPEALEICGATDFDAIVCDVVMPLFDGLRFHAALCRARPELADRLLFATAGPPSLELDAAIAATGRPCLRKPFDGAALRRAVGGG